MLPSLPRPDGAVALRPDLWPETYSKMLGSLHSLERRGQVRVQLILDEVSSEFTSLSRWAMLRHP